MAHYGMPLAAMLILVCFSVDQAVPPARGASDQAAYQVTFEPQPGAIVIRANRQPLATYVYEDPQVLRPYFKDVHAPGGIRLTRHHPPRDGIDPTDHASMHPGLFLAFGDLGGADFWRNRARVEHVTFVKPPCVEKRQGRFAVRNRYVAGDRVVCEELCRYTFVPRPAGFLILWDSTFRSDGSSFYFGDQEEMGLGVRVATPIAVSARPGGRIFDSQGRRNEKEIWGQPAAWCDYSGQVNDRFAGIAIMPDPGNFRRCWWHVRDYGFVVANPFGRGAFGKGNPSKIMVQPGEPFTLRYAILIHSSPTEKDLNLGKGYQDCLDLLETAK